MQNRKFPIPDDLAQTAHVDAALYRAMYARSLADPEGFWGDVAQQFEWMSPWSQVKNTSFSGNVSIRWFEGAKLNITVNCIDRHALATPDKIAILWEGDVAGAVRRITYRALLEEVSKTANALKSLGVCKGDRVTIYMPMVPEAAFAMLACARIGAVHSVVFGGFSPDAIRGRIAGCASDFVITASVGRRGGRVIPLKANIDAAIEGMNIRHVLVLNQADTEMPLRAGRDVWWHDAVPQQSAECPPVAMDAEDPLFILYTSGSTGKPKGLLHTTAGYMVYSAVTTRYVFDIQPDDVYWCSADVGWITGHSYGIYGPLACGTTTLMFEGVPNYPDASRFWQVIDAHQVTKFYTAPTAIRSLMALGDAYVKLTSRRSLKILGSVGEPINPEAWLWYHDVVGDGRCPIVDTWWQTETGGHMLTPLPGAMALKPGSCALPFFGVVPEVYDPQGQLLSGECEGMLYFADSWPGQARTVWGSHARFIETYFSQVPEKYFSGDGCRRDADGYYWITGRADDVIKISGHRLGTAEIEAALDSHPDVAEAAVVGYPHAIKGQGIYAYVILDAGVESSTVLAAELKQLVRAQIGGLAVPDFVHITPGLPKTRSGKIMRRILRKIAENDCAELGDTSTLLDPEIVDKLIATRMNRRKLRLGVNIDHVATLRNARGGAHPCPIAAAQLAAQAGADVITAHLREDRRHIRDDDMRRLKVELALPLNFEMAATEEMLRIALEIKPNSCCLVPENRAERTTEGGLDVAGQVDYLRDFCAKLQTAGIRSSLFIDPEPHQVEAAAMAGVQIVELHTGKYAESSVKSRESREAELLKIKQAAELAYSLGLEVHAGHGLTFENAGAIAAIPELLELNIGHFIIGEAVFLGLPEVIRRVREAMDGVSGA